MMMKKSSKIVKIELRQSSTQVSKPGIHSDTLRLSLMCRNIKTLFNFEPPVTDEEIRAASLQFVRKISGFNKPSKANEAAFFSAVDDIATILNNLLVSLESTPPPKDRLEEAAKARARAAQRFGS